MAASRRFALIPAAGKSERFGAAVPKQYALLAGAPVLRRTIEALNRSVALDATYVVLAQDDEHYAQRIGPIAGVVPLYCGGRARAESVRNGLARIGGQAGPEDWVLVHDAARPCIDAAMLDRLLHELEDDAVGGLLAVPLADTLKRAAIGTQARVAATEARAGLWCAQTPQMFRFGVLQRALSQPDAATATDEAQAVEALGMKPRLVLGSPANIKLTHAEDLALAEAILARQRADAGAIVPWRVGSGFDVHRLVTGRPLVLGGVTLAYERGLHGHSDADVLLHAICDAILGAIAEGDIGRHFPDTDPAYKDADSRALLRTVWERASAAGYALGNVDATVVAEAPRLAPHTARMAANIAADCGAQPGQVNVKATTSEGLGFAGRGEGIAAWATVLLFKRY